MIVPQRRVHVFFAVILVLLVGAKLYSRRIASSQEAPLSKPLDQFPRQIDAWKGKDHNFDASILEVLGADDVLHRAYGHPKGEILWLYVGYYRSQKRGDQIHSPLHCFPGSGWNPTLKEVVPVQLANGAIHVNRMIIQNGLERKMVAYWYQSQERAIANEFLQRLYLILGSFRENRTDGSLIRLSVALEEDDSEAKWATLTGFIQQVYPRLMEFLPQ